MQSQPMIPPPQMVVAIPTLERAQRRSDRRLSIAVFGAVFIATPLLVLAGSRVGVGVVLAALVVLVVAGLIIMWPVVGFYVVGICAILVEQNSLSTPILTDNLDIFHWPNGYEGQLERPIGFIFIFIFL